MEILFAQLENIYNFPTLNVGNQVEFKASFNK